MHILQTSFVHYLPKFIEVAPQLECSCKTFSLLHVLPRYINSILTLAIFVAGARICLKIGAFTEFLGEIAYGGKHRGKQYN